MFGTGNTENKNNIMRNRGFSDLLIGNKGRGTHPAFRQTKCFVLSFIFPFLLFFILVI